MLEAVVRLMLGRPELKRITMLALASYVFLLRVPSEGLPIAVGQFLGAGQPPLFRAHDDRVELFLPRRKNRLHPTTLVRKCWCAKSRFTCPVHVLGAYFAALPVGDQPFLQLSADAARVQLREVLEAIGTPDWHLYWLHDMR